MYHGEGKQEAFLILSGECLLLVEAQERLLRAWDFVHLPPWTEHVLVGAGSGPCVFVAAGARADHPGVRYVAAPFALARGAAVAVDTDSQDEAYARFSPLARVAAARATFRTGDRPAGPRLLRSMVFDTMSVDMTSTDADCLLPAARRPGAQRRGGTGDGDALQGARRSGTREDREPARANDEPVCVCEFEPALELSQPTVSHHLKKLTEAGLLEREERGKWAHFSFYGEALESSRRLADSEGVCCDDDALQTSCGRRCERRYAESARAVTERTWVAAAAAAAPTESEPSFGEALYDAEQRGELPETAVLASLGCGNPTAVAELHEGETVLDLGSGGGIDVILSAKRVGPTGIAFGLDMTDEMLALARQNAREAGVAQRRLPQGRDRADPAARRLGRRRDLELRDQPLGRQGGRADGDRPRAQAGRPDRDQRRRRRGSP